MLPRAELDELRAALETRRSALGTAADRRAKLAAFGTYHNTRPVNLEGQVWAAVDGSYVSFGSPFPYVVEVYRALARTTRGAAVVQTDLFCPLRPTDAKRFDAMDPGGSEDKLGAFRHSLLTSLEVRAGLELVEKHRPDLLLLDGGLLPVEHHAAEAWAELCEMADRVGTTLVGVIEDIATHELGKLIGAGPAFDREVLDNVLEPGEAFIPDQDHAVKSERYATAFVRWASEPRPVGVDVRLRDAKRLPEILDMLGTTVPAHGRGIPLWLDVIDRDVRLHQHEVEQWLRVGLGPLYDAILVLHRRRRPY